MKGLHSPGDEYGKSNPVLLSCQEHWNGVCFLHTPSGETLRAALEVTMKNTDLFNIKPVCLLLLLLFKLGFADYLKNVYILKKVTGPNFAWFPWLWGFVIWY